MYGLANTTATVLRGTTTNAYGDEVDDDVQTATPVVTGVPAQILVRSLRPYDPTSQTVRVVQTVSGLLGSDTPVLDTDRLLDERDGALYAIESITPHAGPGFVGDLELALRRVA